MALCLMEEMSALVDLAADISTDEDVLLQLTLFESLRSQSSNASSTHDLTQGEGISGLIPEAASSSSSNSSPGVKRKRVAARTRSMSHLTSNPTPNPEPPSTERHTHVQRPLSRSVSQGTLTSNSSESRIPSTSGGLTRATLLAQQRRAQQALLAEKLISAGNGGLGDGTSIDEDGRKGKSDNLRGQSRMNGDDDDDDDGGSGSNLVSLTKPDTQNQIRMPKASISAVQARNNQRSTVLLARDRSDFVSAASSMSSGTAAASFSSGVDVSVEDLDNEIVLEGRGLGCTSNSNSSTALQTNRARMPSSRRVVTGRRGATRAGARGRGASPPAPINDEELALMLQQQELMGLDDVFNRPSRRSVYDYDFGFIGTVSSLRIPINLNEANYMDDEELDTSYEGLWRLAERIGDVKPKGAPTSLVMELPVKRFSTRPNMTEEQLKCSICISEYEEGDEQQILPCLHCFHSECVQQWLKQSNACPICRLAVTEE